ncbi:glutaredoxin-C5 [Cucumis melo var. makuwa]|uniref:Glutaredoxin-C5 n=1 Tax=Cucumis melo var. makuwa TaxID=1194695 RepID=A0A5A7TA26_CUCMM|nr:glutaredoxin-C5 [Cucumis melo var. makuwa]
MNREQCGSPSILENLTCALHEPRSDHGVNSYRPKHRKGKNGKGWGLQIQLGGKHIGGCTDTVKLYRKGELEPMLSEANAKHSEA